MHLVGAVCRILMRSSKQVNIPGSNKPVQVTKSHVFRWSGIITYAYNLTSWHPFVWSQMIYVT